MLSLGQLSAVAYLGDGFIVCLECGDARKMPVKDQLIAYNLESVFDDGCYCDDCGKELVEPYVEDEPEEEPEQDALPLQGVCKDCGNGTLNNNLSPAFGFNGDEDFAGGDTLTCLRCGSTHLDIV